MKYFGSSGIRAVYSRELVELAFRVGVAVGESRRSVVVGTDTRTSGGVMKHAVLSGLVAAGAECLDAGVVPTPTLAFVGRDFEAAVMVTASHNPPEYNGLKLLNPDGSSFDTRQQAEVEAALSRDSLSIASWRDVKHSGVYAGAMERHIEGILSHFPGRLKITVVVDAGGGAASEITPRLLKKLGCRVITLNCTPTGFFPRAAEPVDANLGDLKKTVTDSGAALGIAHDGDADRLMAVDDNGRFITGDRLLAVFARELGVKDLVTTLDASLAIDEMGCRVRRTRVGDTFVSEELKKGGDFGGETSGAWIFPKVSLCSDGIYAAAQIVAITGHRRLSELVDAVPVYPLLRGSVAGDGLAMSRLESSLAAMEPLSVSRLDGIKLDFADGWLLVRPSGTEPKIRLTAEAKSEAAARRLYESALGAIRNSVGDGVKTS